MSTECTGRTCGYNVDGETIACTTGDGSCFEASFLEAEISGFYDSSLDAATTSIITTIGKIPPDPAGRKLSILNTNMGLLLAWVEHGSVPAPNAVRYENSNAEIAQALKLRNSVGNEYLAASGCVGKTCGYNVYRNSVGCTTGDGSCFQALFLEAELSGFHDQALADATAAIRGALAAIPADPNGRKTSIIKTRKGLLLVRAEHGQPVHPDAVTSKDDDAKIIAALRLKIPAVAAGGGIPQ